MIRALFALLVWAAMLYTAFLLGQLNMKRKYKDKRDPLPVVQAARGVVTAAQVAPSAVNIAVQALEFSLDEWDRTSD